MSISLSPRNEHQQLEWFPFHHTICHTVKNQYHHTIIKTTSGSIREMEVYNWEHNRPPDTVRTREIAKYYENDTYIDGVIYMYLGMDDKFYCYDGIHRLTALEEPELSHKDTIVFLIDIMKYPRESIIIDRFKTLNKSISIPQLYIVNETHTNTSTNILKKTLQEVVQYYSHQYKQFFSSNSNPQTPHENRDIMMDKLYTLSQMYDELQKYTKEEWIEFCEKKNIVFANSLSKYKLTEKKKQKCIKANFFLFITKDWHTKDIHQCMLH